LAALFLSDVSAKTIEAIGRELPPIGDRGLRFILCEVCGSGGGTLVNYRGDKSRKVHKQCERS
jgi:hypothetical protein